ncbi:hypothetical protein [Planktothrix sp.]|uniref:hypothetical protein n=1 Tax=Planktothrix sp. TaxID=3088171 RepID=UPI0038D4E5C4
MFNFYFLPWLRVYSTLPVVYSRLAWYSMMYPCVYASELWKEYWKSNVSVTPSVSTPPEEPVVTFVSEEITPVELVLPFEPANIVEEKPVITTVEEAQTVFISTETTPQNLPFSPRRKPENRQQVMKLLQSFAITQLEDINRLTLERTKSLAKALGIAQSVQGEKKKTAILKGEVKQRLLDSALLK